MREKLLEMFLLLTDENKDRILEYLEHINDDDSEKTESQLWGSRDS